jgi:hypothetical protein
MKTKRSALFFLAATTFLLAHPVISMADDDDDVYGAVGCPAIAHDVVVADIAALREAIDVSPPGTVIGVNGIISVDDGQGDIIVSTDGVHLTCASEGAAIVGAANGGLIQFVGADAKISYLTVTATTEGAVFFRGDRGPATHNTISCGRSCIPFIGAQGGLAEYNDISRGEKMFGIVPYDGASGITIRKNLVANCTLLGFDSRCIWMLAEDSQVIGNRIWNANFTLSIGASRVRVHKNEVSECVFCIAGGFALQDVEITKNYCNSPFGADYDDFSVCVQMNGINDNLVIANNRLVGDARVNSGGNFDERVPNLVFKDNIIEQGVVDLERLVDATIAGNRISNCAGERLNAQCIMLSDSTNTIVENNTIVGGPRDFGGIEVTSFEPDTSISVIDNKISIAGVPAPPFFDGTAWGVSLLGSNFFVEDNKISVTSETGEATGIRLNGQVFGFTLRINGEIVDEFFDSNPSRASYLGDNKIKTNGTGIRLQGVCDSTLLDNKLKENPVDVHLTLMGSSVFSFTDPDTGDVFEFTDISDGTGGNTVSVDGKTIILEATTTDFETGEPKTVVGDGYLDCDGDGSSDPNFLVGND